MIQQQLDNLLAWAAEALDDIVPAKQDYFAATGGEVHEDDRVYEARMQAFFNWYLLDRPGAKGQTPVQRYLQEKGAGLPGDQKAVLLGLTQTRHSLYEYKGRATIFRRVPKGQLRLRDAFSGQDFDVWERRTMHGLDGGELLEARLIPVEGKFHFAPSITYHPKETRRTILREIKKRRKAKQAIDPRQFVWELERMALQSERFKQVPVEHIYNFETPFLSKRRDTPPPPEKRAQ
jgi:hypothetical protein